MPFASPSGVSVTCNRQTPSGSASWTHRETLTRTRWSFSPSVNGCEAVQKKEQGSMLKATRRASARFERSTHDLFAHDFGSDFRTSIDRKLSRVNPCPLFQPLRRRKARPNLQVPGRAGEIDFLRVLRASACDLPPSGRRSGRSQSVKSQPMTPFRTPLRSDALAARPFYSTLPCSLNSHSSALARPNF
jgi:hypothetical protein